MGAIVRYAPYVDVEFLEPTRAVDHIGYGMVDLMGVVAGRISPNDNVDYQAYSISKVADSRDSTKKNDTLWFDRFTSTLQLCPSINPIDNNLTMWTAQDSGVWSVCKPDGSNTTFIHQDDITPNHLRGINLTQNPPGENQSFALFMYRYATPPNTDPTTSAVWIMFGHRWCLGLFQHEAPRLYKWNDDTSTWTWVMEGPNIFNINKLDTILIRIVYNTLIITNGFDNAEGLVYTDFDIGAPPRNGDDINWSHNTNAATDGAIEYVPIMTFLSEIAIYTQNSPIYFAYSPLQYEASGKLSSAYFWHGYIDTSVLPSGQINPHVLYAHPSTTVGSASVTGVTYDASSATNPMQWRYELTMSTVNTKYSPYVFAVSATEDNTYVAITRSGYWNIDPGRVTSGRVISTTRDITGSITLNNYDGVFTNYSGYHGVRIYTGWFMADADTGVIGDVEKECIFTGFAYDPVFTKDAAGRSYVTMQLVDRSVIMKDTPARNLPPYDGSCVYWVFWDICRRAGFTSVPNNFGVPAVLAWQNPRNPNDYITLEQMVGITDWTQCQLGLCNHVILDRSGWSDAPKYKFEDNIWLWDCINDISDHFMRHWIYFNNWGNLIISDPRTLVGPCAPSPIFTFMELTGPMGTSPTAPNQMTSLSLKAPASQIRNAALAMGYDIIHNEIVSSVVPAYLANGDQYNYIPWARWMVRKNPQLNQAQVNRMAYNMKLLGSRPRPTASWDTAGNSYVFPYDIVKLAEDSWLPGAARILGPFEEFRVTTVSHDFSDSGNKIYKCNYEAEWVSSADRLLYDQWW